MRSFLQLLTVLSALVCLTVAWSKEDHEIFRLKDEVQLSEGANVTFYSWLGLKKNAGADDINKAYRRLSRTLHPDKARGSWLSSLQVPPKQDSKSDKPTTHVYKHKKPSQSEINKFNKEASARFERLSLVANLLRGPTRDRYDFFLSNGFPAWRGTGYYYSRFRPGLGTVLIGLFVWIGGVAHYVILYLNCKRQREFVEKCIKKARRSAWGDDGGLNAIPGINGQTSSGNAQRAAPEEGDSMQWNRKQKRAMEKEKKKDAKNPIKSAKAVKKAKEEGISTPIEAELISGPVGAKKRTIAENGKVFIVDSVGNVFLEDETEEGETVEFLLDPNEILTPTIKDTVLVQGPIYLYNISLGRLLNKQTPEHIAHEANDGEDTHQDVADVALKSGITANANGESRRRKAR